MNIDSGDKMDYIKGFTWGWCSAKGEWLKTTAEESMRLMVKGTGSNTIVIALAALQDKAQPTSIDYKGSHIVSDEELIWAIKNAQKLGLKVILKPTVNVKDGTWRAHINFFDNDILGEPQWNQWFESYTKYMLHYANIARETNCFMLVNGFGLWDWDATLYEKAKAKSNDGYGVYGKPAEAIIKEFYLSKGD